jgi:hypothetical protein
MIVSNCSELSLHTNLFSGKLPESISPLWSQLLNGFWDLDLGKDDPRIREYIAYRQYFVTKLDAWRCYSDNVSLETYQGLVDLVKHLKHNAAARRSSPEVLAFFRSRRTSADLVSQTSVTQSEAPTHYDMKAQYFLQYVCG